MAYNRLKVMRDNIEAIRLAFRLGVAGRSAQNAEERDILRKYAGFGGMKCILNDANELADAAKWSKSDIELFAPTVDCVALSMTIQRMTGSLHVIWTL